MTGKGDPGVGEGATRMMGNAGKDVLLFPDKGPFTEESKKSTLLPAGVGEIRWIIIGHKNAK